MNMFYQKALGDYKLVKIILQGNNCIADITDSDVLCGIAYHL